MKRCTVRYRKTGVRSRGKRLYRRVKRCKRRLVRPRRLSGKPAIVLDIDETSLSNYAGRRRRSRPPPRATSATGAHADRSFKIPNPFYFISD